MRKSMAILLILSLMMSAAACGASTPSAPQTTTGSAVTTTAPGASTSPSFNNTYDLQGEIIDIIGNEVTLKLMEMSTADESGTRVPGSGMGKNGGGTGVPSEKNYTGEERTLVIPVGTPLFMRIQGQGSGTTAASGTGTGPVEQEISLKELTKGMTLRIRYMDDDKTIEKVLAIKPRT